MRCFVVLATLVIVFGVGRVRADEFVADFKDSGNRFKAENASALGGKFEPVAGSLHAVIPPGPLGRLGMDYVGQFQLLGDFEVTIAYDIKSLPRPDPPDTATKDWDYSNNVQLSLHEPGRNAIVYRNHRKSGQGYGYFCGLDEVMSFEHKPATGSRGVLGMRRVGGKLDFLHGAGDGPLISLGSVDWGTESAAVPVVTIFPLRTKDGIDVSFRDFRIKADSIEWSKKPPATRRRNSWSWARWLALPLVLGTLAILWRLGSRRKSDDLRPEGAEPVNDRPAT